MYGYFDDHEIIYDTLNSNNANVKNSNNRIKNVMLKYIWIL